jgi:hypothetical protein
LSETGDNTIIGGLLDEVLKEDALAPSRTGHEIKSVLHPKEALLLDQGRYSESKSTKRTKQFFEISHS